ncbi:5'-methylthioadenosine/adenosylhomocysteine nucleosidase [Borreliella lusitaniae]|uniref:5'-methylthioadenosine/adenosylhomocysteine nucleosidase n=1 Tax=Borreliella lusitaniae TaxID=100177 RepID=UPI003C762566
MILIISAMQEESEEINKIIDDKEEVLLNNYSENKKIYKGKILGKDVISLTTGIGKVNAATWSNQIISKYKVTHIINSGSSGGIKENSNLKISDIIVSSETAYYDFDLTKFGHKIGQVPHLPQKFKTDEELLKKVVHIIENKLLNIDIHIGLILTGDQFVDNEKNLETIKKNFKDALAVDMEGAAIAHVAHIFKIPFIIIRSISDLPNNKDNHIDFNKFLKISSINSSKMTKELIRLI